MKPVFITTWNHWWRDLTWCYWHDRDLTSVCVRNVLLTNIKTPINTMNTATVHLSHSTLDFIWHPCEPDVISPWMSVFPIHWFICGGPPQTDLQLMEESWYGWIKLQKGLISLNKYECYTFQSQNVACLCECISEGYRWHFHFILPTYNAW